MDRAAAARAVSSGGATLTTGGRCDTGQRQECVSGHVHDRGRRGTGADHGSAVEVLPYHRCRPAGRAGAITAIWRWRKWGSCAAPRDDETHAAGVGFGGAGGLFPDEPRRLAVAARLTVIRARPGRFSPK